MSPSLRLSVCYRSPSQLEKVQSTRTHRKQNRNLLLIKSYGKEVLLHLETLLMLKMYPLHIEETQALNYVCDS